MKPGDLGSQGAREKRINLDHLACVREESRERERRVEVRLVTPLGHPVPWRGVEVLW
jgi:hypothetical protein